MNNVLNNVVIIIISLIIYYDATNHGIGKIRGEKPKTGKLDLNLSAGGWALSTIALAIVAVPLYLLNRGQLIKKAKITPVRIGVFHRIITSLTLILCGLAVLYVHLIAIHK